MSLFNELKRRNVIRVAMAYVVAAWLIIQVVETILPAFGYSDVAIRYITIVLAIAFIPTLVFSWAFEITPEGLKREVDVVREHSITRFTGKKLDRIIMLLLALALSYFAFDKFVLDPVEDVQIAESARQEGRSDALIKSYGDMSIAVLPFVNMSSDPEQEYFSDGISEELLNLLSKIPDLRVISRSSAFSFKGKDIAIPEVAKQLNVGHILEGSVRKAGNQVRITAQLIEGRSDTHLWSETYDRDLENIFAIQDEISSAIVAALKGRLNIDLGPEPRSRVSANADAHDAFLRGRYLFAQRTSAGMEGAISEFEKAIALDPNYAIAHAELAMALNLASGSFYRILPRTEANPRAKIHAEKAMALDPGLAEAHAAAGWLFWFDSELEEALETFDQAIRINASYSIVHSWKALLLARLGRYKEMFLAQEQALQLDPLSYVAMNNYVHSLIEKNRLDEAARELEKIRPIAPIIYADYHGRLMAVGGKWAYQVLGNLEELRLEPGSLRAKGLLSTGFAAIGLEQEAFAMYPGKDPGLLILLGRSMEALKAAEELLAEGETNELFALLDVGMALAVIGDFAGARPMLEEMWQRNNGRITLHGFPPWEAAALFVIRREAGDKAGADEVIAAMKHDVQRMREAGYATVSYLSTDYNEGLAAYLEGRRDEGLALIARASQDGYYIEPRVAYLDSLYDDLGFAPIMAGQQARQARERSRFLDIVCNDNPYEEVWQPAEDTCERFAADVGN